MLRALYSSAAGMRAQQLNLDVIANNLANVNTTGFKKSRAEFQDLLYETSRMPGVTSSSGNQVPTGIQVGYGSRPVSTQKLFTQGNYKNTDNKLDLAIEGDGFFQIIQPNGEVAYSRAGSFKVDSEGRVVTPDGFLLDPEVTIPQDTMTVSIETDGTISVVQPGETEASEIGKIELAKFVNPAGLMSIGRNLYLQTEASGDAVVGEPGEEGFGTISQGFLEMANVNVVDEMVNMIAAQRAYEINSKAIQTSDDMLQTMNNLKR
ncbi:flagellar basal-body rod protein FlgG [Desulfococcus sp.]|uniref:flagellar basal-body rod protein FlgG n=1 Tax=Desulfococcus sp. TaxID=2025834 RepID=UPI003593C2C9